MSKKKKSGFFSDFKKFITKGNILDMAVGVIIGGAFNQIVTSLVNDILMPFIGLICNTQDITELKAVLTPEVLAEDGTVLTAEVAIRYGVFISAIINFLIVALTLFVIIRSAMSFQKRMESLRKKEEEAPAPAAPAEPTVEEKTLAVLEEIKGLLANSEDTPKDAE